MTQKPDTRVKIDEYNVEFDKSDEHEPFAMSVERHIEADSIRDWMVPAMFSCLYCFCSVGICAVYYAFRANHNLDKGNLKAARKHTSRAKCLTLTAIGLGVPIVITVIVLYIVGIVWIMNLLKLQQSVYTNQQQQEGMISG